MTKRTALAIVSLGILAAPAMADETGFYVGANALSLLSTYRRADIDGAFSSALSEADSSFTMGPSSVERAHYSWQVNFGYMLTRNFGVELSFLDLGPFRYSGFGTTTSAADGSSSEVHLDLDVRSHGPALAAVGVLPMTNFWDLEARVGAMQAKTKSSFSTLAGDGSQQRRIFGQFNRCDGKCRNRLYGHNSYRAAPRLPSYPTYKRKSAGS